MKKARTPPSGPHDGRARDRRIDAPKPHNAPKGSQVQGNVTNLTQADIRRAVQTQVARSQRKLESTIRDTVQTTISTVMNNGWFSPQQPVAPVGIPPDEPAVRSWDYPAGYNVNWQPRKFEAFSFAQLNWIAQNEPLVGSIIERRKNEIMTSAWDLNDDTDTIGQQETDRIEAFLEYPDRVHPFGTWLRMLLHAMYTIDAACVHVTRTLDGSPYSLDIIDGSLITPLVDENGKLPEPPSPAYLQVIHGTPYSLLTQPDGTLTALDEKGKPLPTNSATSNDLIYFPRNPRPHSPLYGYSQLEIAISAVAIAIKLEQSQLYYFTKGTIPDALLSVPETWSSRQLASWQGYFDSLMRGNLERRSGGAMFVPFGIKEAMVKKYDFSRDQWEWWARVLCAVYQVSSMPYVNLINRATADTAQVTQQEEGTKPDQVWVSDLMNRILRAAFHTNLKFTYQEQERFDPDKQAAADQIDIRNGVKTIAEIRDERGYDPYEVGVGDKPIFVTTQGAVLLQDIESQSAAATQSAQAGAELAGKAPQMQASPPENGEPSANGKANPEPAHTNGNGKPPPEAAQAAKKLLELGGTHKLIKQGDYSYLMINDYLVPVCGPDGEPLL